MVDNGKSIWIWIGMANGTMGNYGNMGLSINGGIQNGWFTMENPNLKWMRTGGIPISGNLHMWWFPWCFSHSWMVYFMEKPL